jgi:predicted ATPase
MKAYEAKHYLMSAQILWDRVANREAYPFSLPAISKIDEIEFHPEVTFFVGENGSGKSTLIEALAVAWGFNAEGGSKNFNFKTFESHSPLANFMRLARSAKKAKDGFFCAPKVISTLLHQSKKWMQYPLLGVHQS